MAEHLIRENIAESIFRKSKKNRENMKYVKEDFIGLTTLGSLFKKHENTILATVDSSVSKNFNLLKPEIQEKLNKDNLIKFTFSEVDDGNFQTDIKLVKNDITEADCDIMVKVVINGETLTITASTSENAIFASSEIISLINSYNGIELSISNFIDFVDKFNRFISDLVYLYLRFLNVYTKSEVSLELRYKKEMIDNFLDYLTDEFNREILKSEVNDEYSDLCINKDKFLISFKAYSQDKVDYLMFDYVYSPEDEKFVQTNVISSKASAVSKIKELFTDNILDFVTAVRDDLAKILENSKVEVETAVVQEANIIVIFKGINVEAKTVTLDLNGVTYTYCLKDATREIVEVEQEIKKILTSNVDDIMIYITNNLVQCTEVFQEIQEVTEDANADMTKDSKEKDKEGNEQEKKDAEKAEKESKKMKKEDKDDLSDKEKKDQEKEDEKDKEEIEKAKKEGKKIKEDKSEDDKKQEKQDKSDVLDAKIKEMEDKIGKEEDAEAKGKLKEQLDKLNDDKTKLNEKKESFKRENRILKAIKEEELDKPDADELQILKSMTDKSGKMTAKTAAAVKGDAVATVKIEAKKLVKEEGLDNPDADELKFLNRMTDKSGKMEKDIADAEKNKEMNATKVEMKNLKKEDIEIVDNNKIIPDRILDTEEQDLQGFEDEYVKQYETGKDIVTEFEDADGDLGDDEMNEIQPEVEEDVPAAVGASTTPASINAFTPDDMGIQEPMAIGEDDIVNYSRDIVNPEKKVFMEPIVNTDINHIEPDGDEVIYAGENYEQNDEIIDAINKVRVEEVIKYIVKKYKEEKNQKHYFITDINKDLGLKKEDKIIKKGDFTLVYNKEDSAVTLLRKSKVFTEQRKSQGKYRKEDNRSTAELRDWRKKNKINYLSGYGYPALGDSIESELVTEQLKLSVQKFMKEDKIGCDLSDIAIVDNKVFEEAINTKGFKVTYLENIKDANTKEKFSVAIIDDKSVIVTTR
jgi:hypothetical protein